MWEWRGPSPFHFISIPHAASEEIKDLAGAISYGWGAIPATVTIGQTQWTTSIFPKDGNYIVPIKKLIRLGEGVEIGDVVGVTVVVAH